MPLQEIPAFEANILSNELVKVIAEETYLSDDMQKDSEFIKALPYIANYAKVGGFTVSDKAFYVEHQRQLFKWTPHDPEWTNTGLIDLGKPPDRDLRNGFKLAASGETLYVGKRTGNLFQSLDAGRNWANITSRLPLRFTHFREMVFVGSTVYIATDKGVLASQNGEHWRVLIDRTQTRIVLDRFAVDGMTVYGVGDTGVYRLDTREQWKQISPNLPDKVISLVINNNRLYIATQHHGMFYIPLGEDHNELSNLPDKTL